MLSFARDIAQGMQFLVKNDIIHRDLKSPNILVFSNPDSPIPICKICDFGYVIPLALWPIIVDYYVMCESYELFQGCRLLCVARLVKFTNHTMQVTFAGTIAWIAPEMLSTQKVNSKTDVYSFAIVLWELITRAPPFANCTFGIHRTHVSIKLLRTSSHAFASAC